MVILGGYDVVPCEVVDVLNPELRRILGRHSRRDCDEFYVWCDEAYGSRDGGRVAKLPVSRIPDAKNPDLFSTALETNGVSASERFGIRNVKRPFADAIWPHLSGRRDLKISEEFLSTDITSEPEESASHYFMLHGQDDDGRIFTGEFLSASISEYPVAFYVDKVPNKFGGIVFTGCCWGALTVNGTALQAMEMWPETPTPRSPEDSIALAYLRAGANAFIGCTGSHYSGSSPDLT